MLTCTPVLRYYNLQEEVTLQCDASQSGLGAALMQNGQPIAYASRALTPTETRYAQIEKELLAIVFACDRFDAYVYGRDLVNMATDQGLEVDPAKVRAISEMPAPTDKLGVQLLLGLAQYLAKFLPHLSDVTKPLRDLTQSNVLWVWNEAQQTAFEKLKEMVTCTQCYVITIFRRKSHCSVMHPSLALEPH